MLRFIKNDSGAVTVDWVLLTAAIASIAIAALIIIVPGINPVANSVEPKMIAAPGVGASFITD